MQFQDIVQDLIDIINAEREQRLLDLLFSILRDRRP